MASPEARTNLIRKCFGKYRRVLKIASPEAKYLFDENILLSIFLTYRPGRAHAVMVRVVVGRARGTVTGVT